MLHFIITLSRNHTLFLRGLLSLCGFRERRTPSDCDTDRWLQYMFPLFNPSAVLPSCSEVDKSTLKLWWDTADAFSLFVESPECSRREHSILSELVLKECFRWPLEDPPPPPLPLHPTLLYNSKILHKPNQPLFDIWRQTPSWVNNDTITKLKIA